MKRKQRGREDRLAFVAVKTFIAFNAMLMLAVLCGGEGAKADIFTYRDRNGNMVITDAPPDNAGDVQTVRDRDGGRSGTGIFRDIEKELTEKYHPRSAIEAASISTVTVKTSIGGGSGFFINKNGYIVTNKHVLRGDASQIKKTEAYIAKMDDRIAADEAAIANAENQLSRMKKDLDVFKAAVDRMSNPAARTVALQKYKDQSEQYNYYETQFRRRKSETEEKILKYRKQKEEFTRKTRMARHDRRFVVILKDKTELEADLVSVSDGHDLALLKIYGCRSPYIQPGAGKEIIQGMKVFAIGSPLGVGDSVSAGIVSGYDRDYIRTDAKIYPGNSGGPLITADGKVIGINTLKLVTRKFEGMGYAIPVERVFQEFGSSLGLGLRP